MITRALEKSKPFIAHQTMWICVITKKAILEAVLTWSSAITPCITGTFIALIIDQAVSFISCIAFVHGMVIDGLAILDG